MASSFGSLTFLTMEPRPPAPTAKVQLESRAGVTGNAAWNTGVRSGPVQVETVADVSSWSGAVTLAATYEAAVGTVLSITYGGQSLGYNALILSVEARPEKIVKGMGGLSGSSAAIVRARWTVETRA